ncbi:nucleoside diphosphate kinase regulator [Streptomyces triticagri]|uniref:Nucleoside diphosphate kinase regulator n=1 Tax=Streptomyces triticagri TaxID=2293568 RepID=A0A372M4G8_9ACTN|nr:GreA/GreB family elongation factor [Streptomyces triticagri]RFU85405.1 nucleoside diphosphate kinase regulator [Streptomyces triticagri]
MSGESVPAEGPAPISEAARRGLEQEVAGLREERAKVAATLEDSDDAVGDRGDAADEVQRADELDRLDNRIGELIRRLSEGAAQGPPPTEEVGVGSTVTVRFEDGAEETLQVAEVAEAGTPDLVTADSPLGRALIGGHTGDTVNYRSPAGRSTVTVVAVGG